MTDATKQKRISGRDRAYRYLRDVVLADPASAGAFLGEQDLADKIGVSRTPVREALFMLASESLLQLVPNRGALVVTPGPDEILQVLQAREMIEIWSARHGRTAISAVAEALRMRLEAQRNLPLAASIDEFIDLDRQFHMEMIASSQNPVLGQMYDVLQARHFTLGVRAMKHGTERRGQVLDEHQAIVDAFTEGDIACVERAIRLHLEATFRSLVHPGEWRDARDGAAALQHGILRHPSA